jgi:hypothetical protein
VALIEIAQRQRIPVRTTTGAVAQVWQNGSRQARLARLLSGVDERVLTLNASRNIGVPLAASGTADVIDASLIEIAVDGDEILTSDPRDIVQLANSAGKRVRVITVSS